MSVTVTADGFVLVRVSLEVRGADDGLDRA
jgi:hypothetical protein